MALFDNPFYADISTSNILDEDLPMVVDLLEYRVNFLESLLDEKDTEIFGLQEELQQLKEPLLLIFETFGENIDLPLDSSLILSRFVFSVIFSVRTVFSEISPLNEVRGEFFARLVPHVKYSLFEAQNTVIQLGVLYRALGHMCGYSGDNIP